MLPFGIKDFILVSNDQRTGSQVLLLPESDLLLLAKSGVAMGRAVAPSHTNLANRYLENRGNHSFNYCQHNLGISRIHAFKIASKCQLDEIEYIAVSPGVFGSCLRVLRGFERLVGEDVTRHPLVVESDIGWDSWTVESPDDYSPVSTPQPISRSLLNRQERHRLIEGLLDYDLNS